MSLSINESLSSAQESYFEGEFRASADKLDAVLAKEQFDWREELRVKQNLGISNYAASLLSKEKSTTRDDHLHADMSAILLNELNKQTATAFQCSMKKSEEASLISDSSSESSRIHVEDLLSALTPELFIIFLNIASLQCEHRQYDSCRTILERLTAFLVVEPQENGASIKVCFLLIEVLLRQWNDSAACYIPQQLNCFQSQALETLNSAESYIANLFNDITISNRPDVSVRDCEGAPIVIDLAELMDTIMSYRISVYTCRINIASGTHVTAEKNLADAVDSFKSMIDPILMECDENITVTDTHKIFRHCNFLSSYFGALNAELPINLTNLKQSLQLQLEMGIYLQSEILFLSGDGGNSVSTMEGIHQNGLQGKQLKLKSYQFYNNTSLVFLEQKRFHLACLYSQKAVENMKSRILSLGHTDNGNGQGNGHGNSNGSSNGNVEGSHYCGQLPHRCTAEVLYNAAVSLLLSGNPLGAILYFEQIIPDLGSSPLLWIRMSECCVTHHADQKRKEASLMLSTPESSGRCRRLELNTSSSSDKENHGQSDTATADMNTSTEHIKGNSTSSSTITRGSSYSLNRAAQYLSKAIFLIRSIRNKTSVTPIPDSISKISDPRSIPSDPHQNPTPNMQSNPHYRVDRLESAALLQLAYVHLELNSPLSALTAAREILGSTDLSQSGTDTRFLAETYASEASCALGKLDDALHILQSQYSHTQEAPSSSSSSSVINSKNFPQYFFTDNSYPTYSGSGCKKEPNGDGLFNPQENLECCSATVGEEINYQKLTATVNFAAALSLQGNFSRAQSLLQSLLEVCPTFTPCIKLLSYLLLRQGQHKEALSILRGSCNSIESTEHDGS